MARCPEPVVCSVLPCCWLEPPRLTFTVPLSQTELLGRIGHGFNFGDALEAPKEGDWGVTIQESYFKTIHDAGFQSVRVPIQWAAHLGAAPAFTIDPAFMQRVDWVVQEAEKNHLTVILDNHNDDELLKNPAANSDRFVAEWKQIAEHYFDAPSSVLFELMNEPDSGMSADVWNALVARTLKVVRASNPQRIVVIDGVPWAGIDSLATLKLPADDLRLAVTFHYYDPLHFTHQGASWIKDSTPWLGTKWYSTNQERLAMSEAFTKAAEWGRQHARPIYLGEFGAYSTGDLASRVRWTTFVVRQARWHHFPWTYWEFCAGFGAYDPKADAWRPPLLQALKSAN